jgi:thiol-disulfide isomerase/thioredoxin
MRLAIILIPLLAVAADTPGIVADVRAAIAQNNLTQGESLIRSYRAARGNTPEMIEAVSWLGRGALAAKQPDRAEVYAAQARQLALEQLSHRKLDAEPHLPLALGASIEVQAQVMADRGERGEAVAFLRRELKTYWMTSIRARIQKNINLLSLEGKPAPALDVRNWLGPKPVPLEQLRGKPLVLFFWAHWCSDCKQVAPDLARLASEYASKGLLVIGPTQHYGYVAGGQDASPRQETAYIDSVRKEFYAALIGMPAPVSEENFRNYGASTTPTLVFVDRKGIVRLYHPGAMTYSEMAAEVSKLTAAGLPATSDRGSAQSR